LVWESEWVLASASESELGSAWASVWESESESESAWVLE
jgi:hypothetical protein